MDYLIDIFSSAARGLLITLFDLKSLIIYVIVFYALNTTYKKHMDFINNNIEPFEKRTFRSLMEEVILASMVTGFLCSLLFLSLKITISGTTALYISYIIIILSAFNIKNSVFSYAVGITGVTILITGMHLEDISTLLLMASVIQMSESLFIYLPGGRDAVPVFIKKSGGISGAFIINRFYPMPMVFLLANQEASPAILGLSLAGSIVAVIGSSFTAVSKSPEKRSSETALALFGTALLITMAALLSYKYFIFKILGLVIAVVVRSAVITLLNRRDNRGESLYSPSKKGLKVLYVVSGGNGDSLGIRQGDVILNINGKDIQTLEGLRTALKELPSYIWMIVTGTNGKKRELQSRLMPDRKNSLGIITVPRENEITYNIDSFNNLKIIKNIVERFKGFNR